jgi:hypothetical protein
MDRAHVCHVKRQLSARFNAAALGKYETNQGGAWGWLAEETGLPVASALADLLQKR